MRMRITRAFHILNMAVLKKLIFLILLFFSSPSFSSTKYEEYNQIKGKEKYDELEGLASHSSCWKRAMNEIESSCKTISLSDHSISKLALLFTNCHFERSGRNTYTCPEGSDIKSCISPDKMGDSDFQIYTEFFTHSINICHYLQARIWRETTEGTINSLSQTSYEVVGKLEESLEYHKEMEKKQSLTLNNQETILTSQQGLAASLNNVHSQMNTAFQEMYEKAESHKLLLDELFGSLNKGFNTIQWLLSLILGEIITLETAIFFMMTSFFICLLPQYSGSHVWLYLILIAYGMTEGLVRRCVFWLSTDQNAMANLHHVLWYSRWSLVTVLGVTYLWRYIVYSNRENSQLKLLQKINDQLSFGRGERNIEEEDIVIDGCYSQTDGENNEEQKEDVPFNNELITNFSNLYQKENKGGRIVTGTQLIDFLSGLYIEQNAVKYLDTLSTHSDDSTYYPPSQYTTNTNEYDTIDTYKITPPNDGSSSQSNSLIRSSLHKELSGNAIPYPPAGPLPSSQHNNRNTVAKKLNDSGVSDVYATPTNYNLRPRRSQTPYNKH